MFEFYRHPPSREPVIHNLHFIHRPYGATQFPDAQKSSVWLDPPDDEADLAAALARFEELSREASAR
ncbi:MULTISPECIES: hypothetical protein [unclassified Mycolicibacterium]|uniref:hypothetical protein n=1 Tax=unclassified Mycolicibacterium TaxID=2636767 RepID=UPI002EDAAB5E